MWVSGGEGGVPELTSLLGRASSASTELSRLQSLEVILIMAPNDFASIYLLHFDFAFNFLSIHGVCLFGECEIEAARNAVWTRLIACAPGSSLGGMLDELTVQGSGDLGAVWAATLPSQNLSHGPPSRKLGSSPPSTRHTSEMGTQPVRGDYRKPGSGLQRI